MPGTAGLDPQVLVVGAGPVGLSMACELFRHGVPCRIIDRTQGSARESRAIVVQARTLEVFEGMGIIDEALDKGRKIHQVNIYLDNKRLTQLVLDELDSPFPFLLILPQYELEAILIKQLSRFGGQVEWQKNLKSLKQDEQGVRVTLDTPGLGEIIQTPWLIGCDGMESTVAQALSMPCKESKQEGTFILIDLQMPWDLPDDEVHQFLFSNGLLAAFPLPAAGYWRLIIDSDGDIRTEKPFELAQRLVQQMEVPDAKMSEPLWLSAYSVPRSLVRRFRAGRCFLAGDAAHTFSPVGGQGMNMGIQDAYNLAWKLGLVVHRRAWEWLLNSYQNERHPLAAATLRQTDRATKVVMLRHPVSRHIRKRLASLLGHFEVVQQRITRRLVELDLSYHQSSIVEEYHMPLLGSCLHLVDKEIPTAFSCLEFGAAPRAGERAPDVLIGGSKNNLRKRLFEVLGGTQHTLLLFSGSASTPENFQAIENLANQIDKLYGQSIKVHVVVPFSDRSDALKCEGPLIFDTAGTLHRRYGVCSGGIYLIRPDGYIGFRSQPILGENLSAYLKRTFIPVK